MLLNQPDPTTTTSSTTSSSTSTSINTTSTTAMENKPNHPDQDHHLYHNHNQTSALFAAAQNGHTECVKLLLFSGSPADVSDENGFTSLHFAAAHGHSSCVETLLTSGAVVDTSTKDGQTPLFLACESGRCDCVRLLLNAGADRSRATTDGCTPLHAAVRSGHVETLRLLLRHPPPGDDPPSAAVTSDLCGGGTLALPAALLNQANSDGWTAAHMAAALGLKECLEVLCSHSEQDIDTRDKCNRTIHDVATDDCKDLLENLNSYRVLVRLQSSGGGAPMCPVEALEEEVKGAVGSQVALCRVSVDRSMRWAQLATALGHAFTSHLHIICGDAETSGEEVQRPPLGLTPSSISSVLIGDTEWLPGQDLPLSPWDLVRKPLSQRITIRLRGLSESCLDESALESLFPLQLLHNYVRLVEQYGNLIFHGPEGSCQEYVANLVARCIKSKQEAAGLVCDVVKVEVEENLSKEQLLETFISCGFLVPAVSSGVSVTSGHAMRCVVVLLEGLEKTSSLTGLMGDLCHSLDNRGSASPLILNTGPHHFCEGSFLIATLSKPRLQGSELRLQQHFRWVTLRWDQEPLHGLLGRHLRRKLLHKMSSGVWTPDGAVERSVQWVSQVWQQLNACLSRLGTHEALLGPQLFLSCPVVPNNTQAVVRWLARLWNAVVVPRVEEAIISRVTAKRSASSSSSLPSSQRPSPSNCGLSAGQQAVVKAALSILVNKAVLLGCPLPRHEIDRYLLEFRGGTLPLSAIGSYKGSGGGGGRKARDGGKLRRSNTSPRKKGSATLNWSCGGSFRDGSLSSADVTFISNGKVQRETSGLNIFSDDETDLIRELETMCSSRSEPDISKISETKDDLILFSSSTTDAPPPRKPETATQRPQTAVVRQSGRSSSSQSSVHQSGERRSAPRVKSQLPVPSSRGQQTRASAAAAGSSSPGPIRTQTLPGRGRNVASNSSSRTKQAPPNNNYRNINDNNQSHEDIWILHRDLHENNNK